MPIQAYPIRSGDGGSSDPQMASGRRTTVPWSPLAKELESLSRNQDISTGTALVLGILELMNTYTLLMWEGNILGIGRGDIQIDCVMVHIIDIECPIVAIIRSYV
ncbi:hypothetical protein CJF30_00009811 [Rutstroemia sp. NJR-2017a BBW]|nr:hypothetical protein CJF30_00009811 [Rutstroemia sp. NJR-2017a BBW]